MAGDVGGVEGGVVCHQDVILDDEIIRKVHQSEIEDDPEPIKGTELRFTLSERAAVYVVITQAVSGHKKGKRCIAGRKRHAKKCTTTRVLGTLARAGTSGPNRIAFSGRIGKKALKPGSYRMLIVAKDLSGNVSVTSHASFTIVK